MNKQNMSFLLITSLFLIFVQPSVADDDQIAEDELKQNTPRIFLDCQRCDRDYVRTEIDWINYVRDRQEADWSWAGTYPSG